ncbi:hypothetical protein [Enterococcus faecalis]|uniref:Uncharacterized protein n=1 Tax=Enterococcus faecalis ATCC 6055 TaxID=1169311 RepID=R3L6C1_ENTFL|nr:hypothetical protein [Enterococcus faecalis]EOK16334.1 hypothetical protein WOU_00236 [Enterococcus faecalis ATCC 6055]
MSSVNKNYDELAVNLVEAWLAHESKVSNEIGRTSVKGQSISVKEVAQAYLDFSNTLISGQLPENLQSDD